MKWRQEVLTSAPSECYYEASSLPLLARPQAISSFRGSCGDPRVLLVFLLFLSKIVIMFCMNEWSQLGTFTKKAKKKKKKSNRFARIYIQ